MNDDTKQIKDNIVKLYSENFSHVEKVIKKKVIDSLNSVGIMFRVFSRTKSKDSMIKKMDTARISKYKKEKRGMQDLIGVRVIVYFEDDIEVCIGLLKRDFKCKSCEHDVNDTETFRPQRINYIFDIPKECGEISKEIRSKCLIDNTFEVQFRTVFSEGWHEVEHDLRYKNQDDWNNEYLLSRDLNALFAVLEMCDSNLLGICDNLAYKKYKTHNWESMIRNRFRLRFPEKNLSKEISKIMVKNENIGKAVFRFDRHKMTMILAEIIEEVTYENIIFIVNWYDTKDGNLFSLMPEHLMRELERIHFDGAKIEKEMPYSSVVSMKYM